MDWLTYVVLQVDVADRWVWKFILLNGILLEVIITTWMWWKSILIWVLIMFCGLKWCRLKSTFLFGSYFWIGFVVEVNLHRWHILATFDVNCSADCGCFKDRDHLFTKCDLYSRLWSLISGWLVTSMTLHGNLQDHLLRFGGLMVFFWKILWWH